MRTLFIKILVWFWIAAALVILAHFVTTHATMRDEPRPRFMGGQSAMFGMSAVEKLERDGKAAASEYLETLERTTQIHAFLFDLDGRELTGRQPSAAVQDVASSFAGDGDLRPMRGDGGEILAKRVNGKAGQYLFVSEGHPPPRPPFPFLPRVWWAQVLAFILTAGLVCYVLARYLTSPIVKLREATRRLSNGDLTARVGLTSRRRDELVDLGSDFDIMAERIEVLMTSQQRLLHDISHELRSPLARLNIAIELARQGDATEVNWAIERMERESQRLDELINQLLTLARLESAAAGQRKTLISLQELVADVAMDADFEAQTQGKSVKVVQNDSCFFYGDEQLLRSAVENVVRNAILYTSEGTEVEVGLSRKNGDDDERALICVRDRGKGVPPSALTDIFRPFYRVGAGRDRQSGGVGLGLSISRRAIEVHGGSITASNAPDGGLLVEMVLPGAVPAHPADRNLAPASLSAKRRLEAL